MVSTNWEHVASAVLLDGGTTTTTGSNTCRRMGGRGAAESLILEEKDAVFPCGRVTISTKSGGTTLQGLADLRRTLLSRLTDQHRNSRWRHKL